MQRKHRDQQHGGCYKFREWLMGCPEETVPLTEAQAYRESAEAAGLTVAAFL
jgi:hypothetical protein